MHTTPSYLPSTAPNFPILLGEISHSPSGLYVSGTLPLPSAMTIAIVGTRRATPDGKVLARHFARDLARYGLSIVSGLAFGIDAAAHEGCLDAGGHTVAVLPCGLDRIYPRSNVRLAERIVETGGALVSEYPSGTEALPYRFLERNRIVSGLARGVLVIEAPVRSGALVTARFAAEQNRECFVIPGAMSHPNYVGSHELIRKGAELVTKPEHILEALGVAMETTGTKETTEVLKEKFKLSDNEVNIFDYLSSIRAVAEIDKIITTVNVQPQAANIALTMLLVKGLIKEEGSGYMVS